MGIDTIIAAAMADLFTSEGETATFTPTTGSTVSCKVIVEKGVQLQPGGFEAVVWSQGITLEYLLAVVGKEADKGETFTVGSTVYRVVSVVENDGIAVKCDVKE